MAMRNANWYMMMLSYLQDYRTHTVLMHMYNSVFRVFFKKAVQRHAIVSTPWIQPRQTINFPSHGLNFVIVRSTLITVNKKIELNFATVDISVIVHHHCLCTAAIHNR